MRVRPLQVFNRAALQGVPGERREQVNIHSYSSIYNIGHRALADLFDGDVTVEEKCDGSQFSFKFEDGELTCRSKGKDQSPGRTDQMFELAVESVKDLDLVVGWTYRGEYLSKPKHNTLSYGRVPKLHVVIFDIDAGEESYLSYTAKAEECARLGLEVVPFLFGGTVNNWETLKDLLDRESFLGGTKIEGFVVKNYARFGPDKKVLMGKFVSEAFKEKHGKEWKNSNPGQGDILLRLGEVYRHENRWLKAIQHLRDSGELQDAPQDIGPLLKEINADLLKEETEQIKDALFKWAWPHIGRKATAGFADWYKTRLAESAFQDSVETDEGGAGECAEIAEEKE